LSPLADLRPSFADLAWPILAGDQAPDFSINLNAGFTIKIHA
jgi:hypothetical protein